MSGWKIGDTIVWHEPGKTPRQGRIVGSFTVDRISGATLALVSLLGEAKHQQVPVDQLREPGEAEPQRTIDEAPDWAKRMA